MKNREAYADTIVAIALTGETLAIHTETLTPYACHALGCDKCLLNNSDYECDDDALKAWAESEYTPTFELDELVMVSDNKSIWTPRYYKEYSKATENKPFVVWASGATSMTAAYHTDVYRYRYCRKPTDEEIAEIKTRNGIKET